MARDRELQVLGASKVAASTSEAVAAKGVTASIRRLCGQGHGPLPGEGLVLTPEGADAARRSEKSAQAAVLYSAKKIRVRASMLSRGVASATLVGSSIPVWAVKRARPSPAES